LSLCIPPSSMAIRFALDSDGSALHTRSDPGKRRPSLNGSGNDDGSQVASPRKATIELRQQWITLREEWSGFLAQRQAEQDAFVEQLLQRMPRQHVDEKLSGFSDSSPSRSEESHPQTNSAVQLQPIRSEKMMVFEDFATEAATRMRQFVGDEESEVSHSQSTSHRKIGSTHSRGKSTVSSEDDNERLHSVREFEKRTSAMENVLFAMEGSHRLRRWFSRIPWGQRILHYIISWTRWLCSLREPERRGCCHAILNSTLFCSFCTLVILANVLVILYTANWTLENESFDVPYAVSGLDIFFCTVYLLESGLKIRVHKAYFFWNEEAPWNVFDLILVILAVYDLIVSLQYDDGHSANMNFMRSLRVVKVSRILRLVRVIRVFRDLRCMLFSIIWSFSSLFWCLVLIFFVILVFSLLIVQLVTEHIVEKDVDGLVKEDFLYYFGSVQVTMATLYQACTGGVDWRNPYELLEYTGEMGAVAFLFYVAFFEFAVFNVLTGVFVDHAMKVSAADRELALAEQKKKERTEAERLRDTCRIIDADGDGKISWVEFHDFLQFENGYRNMASLGLDIFDSKKFFKNLMVMTNQREIEITQFVSGCMRMKGAATGIDLHTLVADLSTFQRRQEQLQEMVASTLKDRSIRFRSNDRVGSIVATPVSQAGASDPMLFASQSNASLSERSNSQGLVVAIPSEGARGIDATPSKPLRAGGLRKSRSELSQISDGFLSLDSVLPRAQEDEAGSQRYKLQI